MSFRAQSISSEDSEQQIDKTKSAKPINLFILNHAK